MFRVVLKFASWKKENDIFDAVKNGFKTVETRPATEKYSQIRTGDTVTLRSLDTGESIEKKVSFVHKYRSIGDMAEAEDTSKIVPGVTTRDRLAEVFEEFKKKWGREYAEKLEKYGIIAIGLE